uniref:ATP synthase complex subunit 8 n=1 Tax=Glandirana emeljanovi TaxID=240395 RepID=A0A513X8T9_9NEOB|nr:ATP synthase F0 subunit 8 [Glandirana emeljanovi]
MPQLDPMPWLFYLTITWSVILLLAPAKILGHIKTDDPHTKATKTFYLSWSWPWQ